jgi:hypothetical protein
MVGDYRSQREYSSKTLRFGCRGNVESHVCVELGFGQTSQLERCQPRRLEESESRGLGGGSLPPGFLDSAFGLARNGRGEG